MPIKHKYVAGNEAAGPQLIDNNSGGEHSMIGKIGKKRQSTSSSYEGGDQGGSAGGYGLPHGMQMGPSGFGTAHGMGPQVGLPSRHGMGGDSEVPRPPIMPREGGIRGGGVSELETMPDHGVHRKTGYDEHRRARMPRGVHGMGEQLENHAMAVAGAGGAGPGAMPHAMMSDELVASTKMGDESVHSCGVHGCGFRGKSSHGLTQHMQRKHSMGSIRKSMHSMGSSGASGSSGGSPSSGAGASSGGMGSSGASGSSSHGSSYRRGEEFYGETESETEMRRVSRDYGQRRRPASYTNGDSG